MLQPTKDWYWFCDNGKLMLSMGEQWQCTTAYSDKQIVNMPSTNQLFSLMDTECYLALAEKLLASGGQFSDAQLTHILINATAALMFHKPVTPKSWLFDQVEAFGSHHRLATISNKYSTGIVVVLTQEHQLSTCMLISSQLQISDGKFLNQFDLIKIAKDRLAPLLSQLSSQLTA